MKMKPLALLLAVLMVFSLCACGNDTASGAPSETKSTADAEKTAVPIESTQPKTIADIANVSTVEDSALEPASTISYPLDGDYTFTMDTIIRNNTAQALGEDSIAVTDGYKAIAEATGVNIEFNMLPETSYQQTMTLSIAAQDYPDLFNQSVGTYDSNLQGAIEDGVLIDMMEYAEEYAPDWYAAYLSDGNYAASLTNSDGSVAKICNKTLPVVTQQALIRGDWLDALDLEAPTDLDSLTDVLRAFKSEYNTTNALLINSDLDSAAEFAFNFSAMGFKMLNFQLKEPGSNEVIAGVATDEYIEYLLYLHSLYEEGLITDDFMSISKENGNWESSYYGGECGVWQDDCKYADAAYAQFADDPNWDAVPFIFSDREYHMAQSMTAGLTSMHISTTCPDPEIAMSFLNYGFTDEGGALVAFGTEGTTYVENDDGSLSYCDIITNNPDGLSYDQAVVLYLSSNWMPYEADQRSLSLSYTEDAVEAIDLWTSYGDDAMSMPTAATLTGDEMTEVFEICGDTLTSLSSIAPGVIVGQYSEEDYREQLDACFNGMNLDRVTEIYQGAYDRYMAGA